MRNTKNKLKKVIATVVMAQLLLTVVNVGSNMDVKPCEVIDYPIIRQL